MKLVRLLVFTVAAIHISYAQETVQRAPNPQATLHYIHAAWDTLTRSMTDCHSLVDIKVTANPILFLPAGMPVPPQVQALTAKCHVKVEALPRRVDKIGDIDPKELPDQGLLYLPKPYIVPGGRFNEMYGWDSFFILLGLEADHREAMAKNMVDDFLFEIENYGGVLNANRTYYLTRSQPPFLTSMIRAVYEDPASFPATAAGRAEARAWLELAYKAAAKDYSTWERPEHLAGNTGLSRYFDYGHGPVPEMADDSSYYSDVIRWILKHPHQGGDAFLIKGSEHPDAAEAQRLKHTSCDVNESRVCMRAWASGYRLTYDYYEGDRAMRESGFDPSNRFGPFSGATEQFAPVCLNSLLYRYARDMEHFAQVLGKPEDAQMWNKRAQKRNAAMHRYLWWPREGVFADWDFAHSRPNEYAYISSLYPLWAGVATHAEAQQMVAKLNLFERPGGLSMSNTDTGLQWDEPFGWAPTNWIGVAGLERAGFHADAARLARKFNHTVDVGFAEEGTIREKYNVDSANADVHVVTGYKQNQIGFGWTNAVYLKMDGIMQQPPALAKAGN